MRIRVLAAAVVALAAAAVRSDAGPITREPEFIQKVNTAIDRGVVWLRGAQEPAGGFDEYPGYPFGIDALAYQTLRVCGVAKDDPAATKLWENLRRDYARAGRGALHTYTAGLLLMAIAEHGEKVRDLASDREVKLSNEDRLWAEEVTRWLVRAQNPDGTWTYGTSNGYEKGRGSSYDHSNTQYATLGLKAAARCGISIPPAVWTKTLDHFLETQDDQGPEVVRFDPDAKAQGATSAPAARDRARGWGYVGRGGAYGSMSAGGVGAVVICRSELIGTPAMTKALETRSEQSARDGLAWLGRNFTVRTNPGPANSMAGMGWHMYYVYALERAGVLAAVEWMADRDWYGEGAAYLCETQTRDGAWGPVAPNRRGQNAPVVVQPNSQSVMDTCFALLFLKKGTVPVRRGAVTQGADAVDIHFERAADVTGKDFEDLLDLALLRWRRATDDDVKRRLFEGAASMGPRIVEPLLVRMDSPDGDDRIAAHALLRFATGEDKGYDPAAARDVREEAVVLWQLWWIGVKDRIRYDAGTKRLKV